MFIVTKNPVKKDAGKIIANVTVASGILTLQCTLEKTDKGVFLNGPSRYVEKLKSETNNGFIRLGSISRESIDDVKREALKQYEQKTGSEV